MKHSHSYTPPLLRIHATPARAVWVLWVMGAVGATFIFRSSKICSAFRAVPVPCLSQFFKQSLGLFYALSTNPLRSIGVGRVVSKRVRGLVPTALADEGVVVRHFVRKGVEGI